MASSIVIGLSSLPPTPERLFSLLDILKNLGFARIFVDWGELFPWSFEPRAAAPYAYSEDALARLSAQAARLGLDLGAALALPLTFPPLWACPGHRRLFAGGPGGPFDYRAAGLHRKFEAIIDDLLSLLPGCRSFLLGLPVPGCPSADPAGAARGMRALADYIENGGGKVWLAAPGPKYQALAEAGPNEPALRLLDSERFAAAESGRGDCALYPARPGAGHASPELALHWLVGIAEEERLRSSSAAESLRDFEAGLGRTWRLVRRAEEARAAAVIEPRGRETSLRGFESALDGIERGLAGLAADAGRFEASLASICLAAPLRRLAAERMLPLKAARRRLEAELELFSALAPD